MSIAYDVIRKKTRNIHNKYIRMVLFLVLKPMNKSEVKDRVTGDRQWNSQIQITVLGRKKWNGREKERGPKTFLHN